MDELGEVLKLELKLPLALAGIALVSLIVWLVVPPLFHLIGRARSWYRVRHLSRCYLPLDRTNTPWRQNRRIYEVK